jgi:hypothetical protein
MDYFFNSILNKKKAIELVKNYEDNSKKLRLGVK